MSPYRCLVLSLLFIAACGAPEPVPEGTLANGLVWAQGRTLEVAQDLRLPAGEYDRPAVGADGRRGVIRLEGAVGVTLDLSGVILRGAPAGSDQDGHEGWGIVLVGCRDVTLKGGHLGGYRGCVVLEDCTGVTLEDMTFDGWYAMRLGSNLAAEDLADWLRPHDNDQGEWLAKYGGAISATGCSDLTVRGCRGRHGQNGILLTRVTGAQVYDNDFSFLSGWGIGMFRASNNTISHNWFDYCVRGYSHGVYSRGQDSAGILMFERCSDNVVAFNSATHGGDGVFLFAGQDLVEGHARERGEPDPGGSDRNLFYGNDLRFSPANALEATFSDRNLVLRNDLSGCAQHGVWGGYSSNTLILGNTIEDTDAGGVTIEHGQDNVIAQNTFRRNNMAVELYWDEDPHLVQGPLGEQRDTSSRDAWILSNVFEQNTQDLVLKQTTGVVIFDNEWIGDGRQPYIDQLTAQGQEVAQETLHGWMADRRGALPSGHFSRSSLGAWEGRYPELLDEFGREKAPKVPGTYLVRAEQRGVEIGDRSTIIMGEWGPWDYRSDEPRPAARLPGGVLREVTWDAAWFRWAPGSEEKPGTDPRHSDLEVWRALADAPLVHKRVANFIAPWSDEDVRAAVGNDHFGLIATTSVELEGGAYDLAVTSDDGVRVLIDGQLIFEDWTWHGAKREARRVELEPGRHELTLEYFQIDGGTALLVELNPIEG